MMRNPFWERQRKARPDEALSSHLKETNTTQVTMEAIDINL